MASDLSHDDEIMYHKLKMIFYILSERIRRGEPIPILLSGLLLAFTPVSRLGMWKRKRRVKVRVPAYVISIGNLTTGGVGKTPAVIARAQEEIQKGSRVAILTRGYGSKKTHEPYVVPPGSFKPDMVEWIGDEPALIMRRLPEVGLVKAADRVAGAKAAIHQLKCNTLILDDGYQSLYLERDENILLLDANAPFGNGYLLPRGILREPVAEMKRATEIVLTRCDQCTPEALANITTEIKKYVSIPIRYTNHVPTGLWEPGSGNRYPLDWLADRPMVALCGIARPEVFFQTLEMLGVKIVDWIALPDHGTISDNMLDREHWIITTEKDAMRLPAGQWKIMALIIEIREI